MKKIIVNKKRLDYSDFNNQKDDVKSKAKWQQVYDVVDGELKLVDAKTAINKYSKIKIGDSAISNYNVNVQQINNIAVDNTFLGWSEMSLLQQNKIVDNICSSYSRSMLSKWIEFNADDKKDKINQIENRLKELNVKQLLERAIYDTVLFGTSYLSPAIDGDDDELDKPLYLVNSKLKKGSLKSFKIIEPIWVIPTTFNFTNPRADDFYKPTQYVVFGNAIDNTRLKRITLIEPVNLIAPVYLFGGISIIQQVLPYILDFMNTKKEIVKLISRFNTNIVYTNMNALRTSIDAYGQSVSLAGNSLARINAMTQLKNNTSTILFDKDTEEFQQLQIQLTGLVDVLTQQGEMIAFAIQQPISKIFGQAPQGMNATGEYDADNYNELIFNAQEKTLRPIIKYIIDIIQLDLFGDIDESIDFTFVPIGSKDPVKESQLKNDEVNRAVSLVQSGIVDPESMNEHIANDKLLKYNNINYKTVEDYE